VQIGFCSQSADLKFVQFEITIHSDHNGPLTLEEVESKLLAHKTNLEQKQAGLCGVLAWGAESKSKQCLGPWRGCCPQQPLLYHRLLCQPSADRMQVSRTLASNIGVMPVEAEYGLELLAMQLYFDKDMAYPSAPPQSDSDVVALK
jgi:hypothetical protein